MHTEHSQHYCTVVSAVQCSVALMYVIVQYCSTMVFSTVLYTGPPLLYSTGPLIMIQCSEQNTVHTLASSTFSVNWEVKRKLRNNYPNTGRDVSMTFVTSQFTGMECGNKHQLFFYVLGSKTESI